MNKLEVQARVLQNGKPLDLDKFEWDEKSCTFSTSENNLIIDFGNIACCTFNTGSDCTFNTCWNCTFKTGDYCTFKTGDYCTFDTGNNCSFKTGWNCTFKTGDYCTFDTGDGCIFKTGDYCTFDTGDYCTFDTGDGCIFKTGYNCTFDTGYNCTFDTGNNCSFKTGDGCIFKTSWSCTFDTGSDCTFDTGRGCIFKTGNNGYFINKSDSNVVIIRNCGKYRIIELDNYTKDKLIKVDMDNIVEKDIKEYRYIDDSTYVIYNTKQVDNYTIYKAEDIEDYFKDKNNTCYVAQLGTLYAHADSIKEAIEDVQFKHLQTKDVQEHITRVKEQGYITANDYRLLTGACRYGTNRWLEENGFTWEDKKSIDEVIELTKGQYGHYRLVELLKGDKE